MLAFRNGRHRIFTTALWKWLGCLQDRMTFSSRQRVVFVASSRLRLEYKHGSRLEHESHLLTNPTRFLIVAGLQNKPPSRHPNIMLPFIAQVLHTQFLLVELLPLPRTRHQQRPPQMRRSLNYLPTTPNQPLPKPSSTVLRQHINVRQIHRRNTISHKPRHPNHLQRLSLRRGRRSPSSRSCKCQVRNIHARTLRF